MGLIETIRSVVKETIEVMKPAQIMTATVESVEPLKLFVDNRFFLEENVLRIPDIYQPGRVTEDHRHTLPEHNTELAFKDEPSEHLHKILEQQTSVVTYTGLKPGDQVLLLRNHGGETFAILGRL